MRPSTRIVAHRRPMLDKWKDRPVRRADDPPATAAFTNPARPRGEIGERRIVGQMGADRHASSAKPCDPIHNFESRVGVFDDVKPKSYIEEAVQFIIPMAIGARRRFPQHRVESENIDWVMTGQIEPVDAIHAASPEANRAE